MLTLCLAIALGRDTLRPPSITSVANMGVIIHNSRGAVLIDGLQQRYEDYPFPPDSVVRQIVGGQGLYAGLKYGLVTHYHRDHHSVESETAFLRASAARRVAGPPQAIDSLLPSRTIDAWHKNGPLIADSAMGLAIQAFDVPHTWQQRHARVQNIAYLVTMDGVSVLHLGDADVDPSAFGRLNLGKVDVLVAPVWFLQSTEGRRIITEQIRPSQVIATHLGPGASEDRNPNRLDGIRIRYFTRPGQRVTTDRPASPNE